MPGEVELERMVIRLVGDTTDYQRTLEQATSQSKRAADDISNSGKKVTDTFNQASFGVKDTRRSLMLLHAADALPPEATHSMMAFSQATVLAKESANGLIFGLTGIKGALAASGIGAAAVAIGMYVTRLMEELSKAREAAAAAFASMASGAVTAQQAVEKLRIDVLTSGLKELADTVNPGFWGSIRNGLMRAFGVDPIIRDINLLVARIRNAEQYFNQLYQDPRVRALQLESAQRTLIESFRDTELSMRMQAQTAGLVEREAQQMTMALRLAAYGGISLEEAMRRLGPLFSSMRQSGIVQDIGEMTRSMRELQDEAARSGLPDVTARLVGMAQEFLRANPSVGNLTNAMERLAPVLRGTREALQTTNFNSFIRGVREQAAVAGLSSERAQLYRMSLDGLTESQLEAGMAAARHAEAIQAMMAPLERLEGARAGSAEALSRIADYQRRFEATARAASVRERLLADQQRGLASPAGMANLAGTGGSIAALEDQRNRDELRRRAGLAPAQPPTPARPPEPAPVPAPAERRGIASAGGTAGARPQRAVPAQARPQDTPLSRAGRFLGNPWDAGVSSLLGFFAPALARGLAGDRGRQPDTPAVRARDLAAPVQPIPLQLPSPRPPAQQPGQPPAASSNRVEDLLVQIRDLMRQEQQREAVPERLSNISGGSL